MKYALKDAIGYRIKRCSNHIDQQLNITLKPYDIGIEQRATLEIIKFEKDVTQTLLAQMLQKDKTTICRTLNAIEKKGLIQTTPLEQDKRTKQIRLTQKAQEILQQSLNNVETYRKTLQEKLTQEEIDQLFTILDKLMDS